MLPHVFKCYCERHKLKEIFHSWCIYAKYTNSRAQPKQRILSIPFKHFFSRFLPRNIIHTQKAYVLSLDLELSSASEKQWMEWMRWNINLTFSWSGPFLFESIFYCFVCLLVDTSKQSQRTSSWLSFAHSKQKRESVRRKIYGMSFEISRGKLIKCLFTGGFNLSHSFPLPDFLTHNSI